MLDIAVSLQTSTQAAITSALRKYTDSMSWDEIYSPGYAVDMSQADSIVAQYRDSIFSDSGAAEQESPTDNADSSGNATNTVASTTFGRIFWHALLTDGPELARRYVFNTEPLTNARPYLPLTKRWPTCRIR